LLNIDKEGHKYEPGRIIEGALEGKFDAFDEKNIYPDKKPLTFIVIFNLWKNTKMSVVL
jgi:hypothetical protein